MRRRACSVMLVGIVVILSMLLVTATTVES